MSVPAFGLSPEDLARVMDQFGVAADQVRRDHAISHILAVLSRSHRDRLIFFGGTALSRTHLDDERLSEDIDLIVAVGNRDVVADRLRRDVDRALLRTHGRLTWNPAWTPNSDVAPALIETASRVVIKVQLLRAARYEPWPTEERAIQQRYSDAPPATLRVPTLAAFAGWKTAAWAERGSPRDLYDLWALANVGALNAESAALFAQHGPINKPPRSWMFSKAPAAAQWQAQLASQTRLTISADEALNVVRSAWSTAINEPW
jgi:predicted nucleotidyltransferase component of viral defense system